MPVALEAITFDPEEPSIPGAVELCLSPALRTRQWNVPDHPFRIDLGRRAALNVERMIKTAFDEVVVGLDRDCGDVTTLPWITAVIVSAQREHYVEIEDGVQYTALKLRVSLYRDDGTEIWSTSTEPVIGSKPALAGRGIFGGWFTARSLALPFDLFAGFERDLRHADAARDFGEVLGRSLEEVYEELLASDVVRAAVAEASPMGGS